MANLEWPINLTPYLWTEGGSQGTWREDANSTQKHPGAVELSSNFFLRANSANYHATMSPHKLKGLIENCPRSLVAWIKLFVTLSAAHFRVHHHLPSSFPIPAIHLCHVDSLHLVLHPNESSLCFSFCLAAT